MPTLTEKRILELMKEEWDRKVANLDKSLVEFLGADDSDGKRGIIGVNTKVRHKGSQLLYTVHEVGPRDVTLETPEGKLFTVKDHEFEEEYELA